jgi:hypothetical protein
MLTIVNMFATHTKIRSIGYKSIPVESGIPYDEKKGIIPNEGGRVSDMDGLYCAGWLATGPRGVIVDTMNEAYKVAQGILNDWKSGNQDQGATIKPGYTQVLTKLSFFKAAKCVI